MIDLDELLQPISEENPSGKDLRYAPVSAQIKEARRVEDELDQGVWKTEIKKADYPLVIRLATDALKKQGKDLQVAAWLTEAITHQDGYSGLEQGLELMSRLLAEFWDTVYPAIDEDGDLELRATPLLWVATQLDRVIRSNPLTAGGYSWFDYHFAKSIPSEEEAARDETKRALRQDAIDRERPTMDVFEKACAETPLTFYEGRQQEIAAAMARLDALSALADEKFAEASPGLGHLRGLLEEMEQTVRVILVKRRQSESLRTAPAPAAVSAPPPPAMAVDDWGEPIVSAPSMAASQPDSWGQPADSWEQPAWSEPAAAAPALDPEEPIRRVAEIAALLRRANSHSPVPYLMLRGARWGELYAAGEDPDFMTLEAPPTQMRIDMKRFWYSNDWDELLNLTENAMALPCGRAWLDVQRCAVKAAEATGREAVARALKSALRTLLEDYPRLPDWTLNDDTPAASSETKEWLRAERLAGGGRSRALPVFVPAEPAPAANGDGETALKDAFDLAMEAAREGRTEEALTIISREAAQESSGRGRFLRKVQLAQICLATRNDAIAAPILEQISEEIERRQLEQWETPELIAQALAMLVQCLDQPGGDTERRRRLYSQICLLDPARALSLAR
ncbi:MAG: type VI secretion system protein TssA [Bryobacteraceae bacterium]|nr:type VI secretion system protein TssA [Bryobacteraceae bacterium]